MIFNFYRVNYLQLVSLDNPLIILFCITTQYSNSSEIQCGFLCKCSFMHCAFVLEEIILYLNNICMLNYVQLFSFIPNIGLCLVIFKLLILEF